MMLFPNYRDYYRSFPNYNDAVLITIYIKYRQMLINLR